MGGYLQTRYRANPHTNETMQNPISSKIEGIGSLVSLSGSVHRLGGLVCVQVSNKTKLWVCKERV